LNDNVYDVTSHPTGKDFYGPGSGYHALAGKDATKALARMDKDLVNNLDLSDLTGDELKTLGQWEAKFKSKYTIVGTLERPEDARL